MASIKLVYIGGGSSRGAGTMASFLERGEQFAGSEVVLVDLDPDHLEIVRRMAQRIADEKGLDITDPRHHRSPRRPSPTPTPSSPASVPAGSRRAPSTSGSPSSTA